MNCEQICKISHKNFNRNENISKSIRRATFLNTPYITLAVFFFNCPDKARTTLETVQPFQTNKWALKQNAATVSPKKRANFGKQ